MQNNNNNKPKTFVNVALSYTKSTKGTHVLTNEDAGLTIYVPKPFFAAGGVKAEQGDTFRIVIEAVNQ
jgi:hypothetical protein